MAQQQEMTEMDPDDASMLAKSTEYLSNKVDRSCTELPLSPTEHALGMDEISKLLEPGYLPLENGYTRTADGCLFIACLTPMPGCSGSMVDWWFTYCDNTPKYMWWHPLDHVEGRWSDGYHAVAPEDRKSEHYVGHSHIVKEYVNREMNSLHIDFKDPSEYGLDKSRFAEAGVTACLCARINVHDMVAGDTGVGHLCHMICERDGRCEMRSRFWLGDIKKNCGVFPPKWLVNYIGNTRVGRTLRGPTKLARGILLHCREEMACLAALLPELTANHPLYQKGWGTGASSTAQLSSGISGEGKAIESERVAPVAGLQEARL